MRTLLILAVVLTATPATAQKRAVPTFESQETVGKLTRIDELVIKKLRELGVQPARVCSDEVFVRRAYLDVIGTLPTADEARTFLLENNRKKRSELIDELLERDEFADYWAMKWGDLLRIKAEFPINLWPNAVQAYHRWIRTCIDENMPYDRFAREIITASGSNFRKPQVNFYRATQSNTPEALAQAVALTFMGARAENWPNESLSGMAAFFSQVAYKGTAEWKEEIVFFDTVKASEDAAAGKLAKASFPDGTRAQLSANRDPRELFADWLIRPENPWFARNAVNRIWYWLQGRGIIHEPDDIRHDNPPCNPDLITYLQNELITSGYDLKHVYRLILNSNTYQLSSIPQSDDPKAEALLAYYPLRRLDAEVLVDALCQITGTTEEYSSPIPEPFTFIPEDQRSIALADGSITSSFLEMFGRPARDTGLQSERNNRSTASQRLHMLNSSHVQRKIVESQKLKSMLVSKRDPRKAVVSLYLTVLSRFPTNEEIKIVEQYSKSGDVKGPDIVVDLTWALMNSAEFLYRH